MADDEVGNSDSGNLRKRGSGPEASPAKRWTTESQTSGTQMMMPGTVSKIQDGYVSEASAWSASDVTMSEGAGMEQNHEMKAAEIWALISSPVIDIHIF
jgi:hypothetical protein